MRLLFSKHLSLRLLLAAALIALILCLLPVRVNAPGQAARPTPQLAAAPSPSGVPAGADLSERTQEGCFLHKTLYYEPCGHSVQRRETLNARLVGLSRQALEAEIGEVLPGATVTGFSAREVDATIRLPIPCPLHWVLAAGEDGRLAVMQNLSGDALETVRGTDVALDRLSEQQREALPALFDDAQALEGVLESYGS